MPTSNLISFSIIANHAVAILALTILIIAWIMHGRRSNHVEEAKKEMEEGRLPSCPVCRKLAIAFFVLMILPHFIGACLQFWRQNG